jgi:hypothetical protein
MYIFNFKKTMPLEKKLSLIGKFPQSGRRALKSGSGKVFLQYSGRWILQLKTANTENHAASYVHNPN